MNDASPTHDRRFIGNWMWLFPVGYLAHIVEEWRANFNGWIKDFWRVESSDAYFLIWNFAALLGMVIGILWVLKTKSWRWLILGFGVSVLGNGLLHLCGSIRTQTYSPGLITSFIFWFPLAAFTIVRAWMVKMNASTKTAGIIFGILANIFILILVFGFPRLFSI